MALTPYPFDPRTGAGDIVPDAIVAEVEDPLDAELPDRLLHAFPRARALMIAAAGDRAALYELRPQHRIIFDVSIQGAVDALRSGLDARKGD